MKNMITAEEFYIMIHKAAKKFMKTIHSPCIIFYVGIRKISIDIKPRNFAHLIGVPTTGSANEYGFCTTSFSQDSHHFFYDIYYNRIKVNVLAALPELISKKSYIYEKTNAMVGILDFFSSANDLVLIGIDETELFDTKVKNKGVFRIYNYNSNISFTLDGSNFQKLHLKSCTSFAPGTIKKSYINNQKVFPIDEVIIMKKSNKRNIESSIIRNNLQVTTRDFDYDFVSDPYDVYSLEEIQKINN
jgi:hypothetical protein